MFVTECSSSVWTQGAVNFIYSNFQIWCLYGNLQIKLFILSMYVCCWGIGYTFMLKNIRKAEGGQFVMLKTYLFIRPLRECD